MAIRQTRPDVYKELLISKANYDWTVKQDSKQKKKYQQLASIIQVENLGYWPELIIEAAGRKEILAVKNMIEQHGLAMSQLIQHAIGMGNPTILTSLADANGDRYFDHLRTLQTANPAEAGALIMSVSHETLTYQLRRSLQQLDGFSDFLLKKAHPFVAATAIQAHLNKKGEFNRWNLLSSRCLLDFLDLSCKNKCEECILSVTKHFQTLATKNLQSLLHQLQLRLKEGPAKLTWLSETYSQLYYSKKLSLEEVVEPLAIIGSHEHYALISSILQPSVDARISSALFFKLAEWNKHPIQVKNVMGHASDIQIIDFLNELSSSEKLKTYKHWAYAASQRVINRPDLMTSLRQDSQRRIKRLHKVHRQEAALHGLADQVRTIHENLLCPICIKLLTNPRQTLCGHLFCLDCISEVFRHRDRDYANCPLCHDTVQSDELEKPAHALESILEVIKKKPAPEKDTH